MYSIIKYSIGSFLYVSLACSQIKLDINTIPDEVDVYLDGVNLGTSPIRNERIIPGAHIFEIKNGLVETSIEQRNKWIGSLATELASDVIK